MGGALNLEEKDGRPNLDGLPAALKEYVTGWLLRPYKVLTESVQWRNHAYACPLFCLAAVQGWGLRDGGEDYGAGATAYMNQRTFNHFIANENPEDLHGFLRDFREGERTIDALNSVLNEAGLPRVEIFDVGRCDQEGRFYPTIPDDTVIVAGWKAPGPGEPAASRVYVVLNV